MKYTAEVKLNGILQVEVDSDDDRRAAEDVKRLLFDRHKLSPEKYEVTLFKEHEINKESS